MHIQKRPEQFRFIQRGKRIRIIGQQLSFFLRRIIESVAEFEKGLALSAQKLLKQTYAHGFRKWNRFRRNLRHTVPVPGREPVFPQRTVFQLFQRDPILLNTEAVFQNIFHGHHGNGRSQFPAVCKSHIREDELFPGRHQGFEKQVTSVIGQLGIVALDRLQKVKGLGRVNAGELSVIKSENGDDFSRDSPQGNKRTEGDLVAQKMLFSSGKRIFGTQTGDEHLRRDQRLFISRRCVADDFADGHSERSQFRQILPAAA